MLSPDIDQTVKAKRRPPIVRALMAIGVALPLAGVHAAGGQTRRVPVTQEQVSRLGIKIAKVRTGVIRRDIQVPGELKLDSDRVTHVVCPTAGTVREIGKRVGESVEAGEPLAWIESAELADAKLEFCARAAELQRLEGELRDAVAVRDNVSKLMGLLRAGAGEAEIAQLDGLDMGPHRAQLLDAYASYLRGVASRPAEATASTKGSGAPTSTSLSGVAGIEFRAALDMARHETAAAHTRAVQEHQLAAFAAAAAEKRARLRGATAEDIASLRALVSGAAVMTRGSNTEGGGGPLPVVEALQKDERFAWYALRAPRAGTLLSTRLTMGASVDAGAEAYVLADLTSLWVDLAVSQTDASSIREGLDAAIHVPGGTPVTSQITFVSRQVDSEARTVLARAALSNPDGRLRPGAFVQVAVRVPSDGETLLIPKASVQLVDDRTCVFVWGKAGFEAREVVTGMSDGDQVEILIGLREGEAVAAENAFHLKAELAKSAAGGVGGHGHAH